MYFTQKFNNKVNELDCLELKDFMEGMKESWRSKLSEELGFYWDNTEIREYWQNVRKVIDSFFMETEKQLIITECKKRNLSQEETTQILKQYI